MLAAKPTHNIVTCILFRRITVYPHRQDTNANKNEICNAKAVPVYSKKS